MKTTSKLIKADLKFVIESQKLAGFPGKISKSVLNHKPDMRKIRRAAKKFGAQTPKRGSWKKRRAAALERLALLGIPPKNLSVTTKQLERLLGELEGGGPA